MKFDKDVYYVGVNDYNIDLFEGQFPVENGMAYNSYVILDEKVAIFDTVDANFIVQWLSNVKNVLNGKQPDYLIIQHVEPDHSSGIKLIIENYPSIKLIVNSKSLVMIENYYGKLPCEKIIVSDGDILNLGKHNLKFVFAPMIHWPEVMMTYEENSKILFSADAFGKFGTLDTDEDWACEARRYYFGIVGKFGMPVQNLFKKLSNLDINAICPLHGPVLEENLSYYLNLYQIWSSYGIEAKGTAIFYTSVYGNTKKAVDKLNEILTKNGEKTAVFDLIRCDMTEALEDAFKYGKIILATTTYNGDIFPPMHEFITHLTARNYQNRTIGFIENGSWAPTAKKVMQSMLENCKNVKFFENHVSILSGVKEENIEQIKALSNEILSI